MFITRARTLEELKEDFIVEIDRRIADLVAECGHATAAEVSRITRARTELVRLRDYWMDVEILHPTPTRKRNKS